jgi:hypothetical protein
MRNTQGDPEHAPAPVQFPDGGWTIKPDLIVEGPKNRFKPD